MLQKLSQEQVLKESMSLIADAYNNSRSPILAIDLYPERGRNRNLHFINEMARVLEVDISDPNKKETKEFKKKMESAVYYMNWFYNGKAVPDDEKENLKIVQEPAFWQAIEILRLPFLPFEWLSVKIDGWLGESRALYKTKLDCHIFFESSGILEKVFEKKGGIAGRFNETKRLVFAVKSDVKSKEGQERTLKAGMSLIVEAYDVAAAKTADKKEARREIFISVITSKLKVNISDPEFKEKMCKAYDSMHVYYGGKAVPAGEKDNPSIARDKTNGEAFKAALLTATKILLAIPTLGMGKDTFTSSRVAKTSFADVIIKQKAEAQAKKQL